jgi:PAS domain S-box-containing protein
MGQSGETIIVTRDQEGVIRVLHRARPGGGEVWERADSLAGYELVNRSLSGEERVYWEGITDSRGVGVWAAVRNLSAADMGIIVKVDADEGRAPLTLFRRVSTRLALSLGAFAVLFGTILGFRFSRPIKELAEVADRIRGGALSARAVEEGEDEVGLLARTFNDMAAEMEEQVTLLREFQRYFDLSLDMLCIAGPDGYFRRVNPAFERTLGWSTEELLTRSFLEFVHPDDLKKTEEEIVRLNRGHPTISFENRYRLPGGGYKHLLWRAYPDEASGLIYAIARDVTEQDELRRRNEARIRTLTEQLAQVRGDSNG